MESYKEYLLKEIIKIVDSATVSGGYCLDFKWPDGKTVLETVSERLVDFFDKEFEKNFEEKFLEKLNDFLQSK